MLSGAQKAPDAFRTISEVAAELDLPQLVLRFWETKFVTIKPLKRGGGRRYYRPDDVELLRGIRALLYRDGLTIKGVQKILKEQGQRYVIELGRGLTSLVAPMASAAVREAGSNVHPFPRERDAGYGMGSAERERFSALLDELTDLKARLAARRRPFASG